ncbi:MAG: hypothetical protein LBS87_01895, partial [Puniceicoccales bacterium]|nr:hypothetical protein [Puniceicoccales bacterium]
MYNGGKIWAIWHNRLIGRLAFWGMCLFGTGAFANTMTRNSALNVGNADTEVRFSTDGVNEPANGVGTPFTGGGGRILSIAVGDIGAGTNVPVARGIYFSLTGYDFSGKTLTLNNDNIDYTGSVDYLISVYTSSARYENSPGSRDYIRVPAAAINLFGVYEATASPFTIALDNSGTGTKVYRFSVEAEAPKFPGKKLSAADLGKLSATELASLRENIKNIGEIDPATKAQLDTELTPRELILLLNDIKVKLKSKQELKQLITQMQWAKEVKYQYKHAVFVGVPSVYLNTNDSTYNGSNFTFNPNGAKVEATASTNSPEAGSAVFGVGVAIIEDGVSNSNVVFNNWSVRNFGENTVLSAISTNNVRDSYSVVFGIAEANKPVSFSGWRVGNFGDSAALTACSIGTSGGKSAAVFGGAMISGGTFDNWQVGNFGKGANVIAKAIASGDSGGAGGGLSAAAFGVANAFDNYGGTVNFEQWTIGSFTGDISNHTIISAIASSFGAGGAGGGQWAAVFGAANGSNGFGAEGKNTVNFDDWRVGEGSGFGDYAELTANATSTSSGTGGSGGGQFSVVFGAANACNSVSNLVGDDDTETTRDNEVNFNNWWIGNVAENWADNNLVISEGFGNNAKLKSIAKSTSTSADYGSGGAQFAAVFGVANAGNGFTPAPSGYRGGGGAGSNTINFNGWKIGKFRNSATLIAKAISSSPGTYGDGSGIGNGAGGSQFSVVFGVANGSDAIDGLNTLNFNNWKIGNITQTADELQILEGFGNGAKLKSVAASVTSTGDNTGGAQWSAVFGLANASGTVNFNDWMVGEFGSDATLKAKASSGGGCLHAVVFGVAHTRSDTVNFNNWKIGNIKQITNGVQILGGFGDRAKLIADVSANHFGTRGVGGNRQAAVFGMADADNGAMNFSNWEIGKFGNFANLLAKTDIVLTNEANPEGANSAQGAVVFGAANTNAAYYEVNFANWKIGNISKTIDGENSKLEIGEGFGDNAMLGANAVSSSSHGAGGDQRAAVFGAARMNSKLANFNDWMVGKFGNGAKLAATAAAAAIGSGAGSGQWAVVFGLGNAVSGSIADSSGTVNFDNWKIGNIS